MDQLLQKTRMLNELLQKENTLQSDTDMPYSHMADVLSDIIDCNAYLLSDSGSLIGYAIAHDFNNERVKEIINKQQFPYTYISQIEKLEQTTENVSIEEEITVFPFELKNELFDTFTTIVPIYGAGQRIGTILLGRIGRKFDTSDLILVEYCATVVGMQILQQKTNEIATNMRRANVVQMSIKSLSFSELKAVKAVFKELNGDEGILTTSSIADRIGITRSVIVNALRKLESAGVIDTRSLGMKGTFIKITNDQLISTLDKESVG